VMPATAEKVLRALGCGVPASLEAMAWGGLPVDAPLPELEQLFPRLDKDAYFADAAPAASPSQERAMEPTVPPPSAPPPAAEPVAAITYDDFMKVQLRVATVRAAEEIPKSNKLVKLTVDLGDEQRTIVAGIRKSYSPDQLVGRQVVIVVNLQPAKLMGVESQGMVLAAEVGGKAVLLGFDGDPAPGTKIK
jgi:methionyl-tRNA synthetase